MIETNRLAIIIDDGAVYTDDKVIIGLDFSACGIPEDLHAIQWLDGQGEVEYRDTRHGKTENPKRFIQHHLQPHLLFGLSDKGY